MSFPSPFDIATGRADGWRSIKVDGRNPSVAQAYVPITDAGVYRTPQPSGAAHLRIRAGGNAADTPAGAGARAIDLYGLDASGLEVTERIVTAGASASASSATAFMRLMDARVVLSGTYATQAAGSHVGDITIEATNGDLWARIPINGFPEVNARIGAFTVPVDYEAYVIGVRANCDTGKVADAILFKRENIMQTAAPYSPMAMLAQYFNIAGYFDISYDAPIRLPPLTDVGVMAAVDVQTARIGVGIGLLLRRIM